MSYSATVVADSISEVGYLTPKSFPISTPPYRLTTMLVEEPRPIHAEHLRHRAFSYSVASSRALPASKLIEQVETDPYLPLFWGMMKSGMTSDREVSAGQRVKAEYLILKQRDAAVALVKELIHLNSDFPDEEKVGLHKQIVNRYLEPWMWVTVLTTGTDQAWRNFFFLRCHEDAEPSMRHTAELMRGVVGASTPVVVRAGEWHLPFIQPQDWVDVQGAAQLPSQSSDAGADAEAHNERVTDLLKQVSAGRCARTSYLTHLGVRDLSEDVRLHNSLLAGATKSPPEPIHASPLEHQATPLLPGESARGNLVGWRSYRSTIPGEAGPTAEVQARASSTFQPVEAPNV